MPLGHTTSGFIVANAPSISRALNAAYAFCSSFEAEVSLVPETGKDLCLHQKFSLAHDLLVIDPDVELPADYVDVRRRIPIRAGVCAVGISERDVHARILLILEDLADHIFQIDVRADGEFTDAIAVGISVRVLPEVVLQFSILRVGFGQAIALHADREGSLPQVAELRAQIIADHSVDHEGPVHFSGSREDLASRKVPPLFRGDNAAGLKPLIVRVQIGCEIGAGGGRGANFRSLAHHLDNFLAQAVHTLKIGTHAFQHDLAVDVDHMRVTDLAPVHNVSHLNARAQLIALRLYGKDRHLALFEVFKNLAGQVPERTVCQFLNHPGVIRRAKLLEFCHDRGRDLQRHLIRDDADALGGLNPQADIHRITGPGSEFGVKGKLIQVDVIRTYRSAHYPTFVTAAGSSLSARPASVSPMM